MCLIIKKMSGQEEIGPMIVRVVKHGALLIGTRHGEGIGSASAYRMMMNHDQSCSCSVVV